MTTFRNDLMSLFRPIVKPGTLTQPVVDRFDSILDNAGVPRDSQAGAPSTDASTPAPAPEGTSQTLPANADILFQSLTNRNAPALTDQDFKNAAIELGVDEKIVRAVRKVEAPRGPFDDDGRPSILFERHVFARNTSPKGRFNASHPDISGPAYGPGGYGSYGGQYAKLAKAYALDPMAALEACSWGAFQVLGENWQALGYESPWDMAKQLSISEQEHLESFIRFVKANHLGDELQHCRPGNAESWIPFVAVYNGAGFRRFNYHMKAAEASR